MIEARILCSSFKEEIDSLDGGNVASPSKGTAATVRECTRSDLSKPIIISLVQYADSHSFPIKFPDVAPETSETMMLTCNLLLKTVNH